MTDFFTELEREALAAARRRADRRLPRVPLAVVPGLAVAAIVVIALLAVRNPSEETTRIRPPSAPAVASATVSVRNATTASGLAHRVAKRLRAAGYRIGFLGNSRDQFRATSIVMYEPGAATPARDVARRLGIAALRPFTETRRRRADVVVIVGRDLV